MRNPHSSYVRMLSAVRIVQRKLGWKEVGDEDEWDLYWTDTSVGIERIMRLKRTQVRCPHTPLCMKQVAGVIVWGCKGAQGCGSVDCGHVREDRLLCCEGLGDGMHPPSAQACFGRFSNMGGAAVTS